MRKALCAFLLHFRNPKKAEKKNATSVNQPNCFTSSFEAPEIYLANFQLYFLVLP